ncbi:hypothetical protein ACERIT_04745 [Halopenitus sp. H-Gu1]|uniref:hypothetical protein n=1 Tax=Halopenitus sp. H-Gu1 TaxID=3242697 RepID=UPI00359E108A
MDTSIDVDAPSDAGQSGGSSGTSGSDSRPIVGIDGRAFSLRAFGIALVAIAVGGFLGGSLLGIVPLVGGALGNAIGVVVVTFLLGSIGADRRYVETGLAGAGVGTVSALAGLVSVGILPVGVRFLREYGMGVAGFGAAIGIVLALVGYYFGRDLRAGLTRDIDR